MARVNIYGIKEIVVIVDALKDEKELVDIVRSLFQKGKTTNLSIIL